MSQYQVETIVGRCPRCGTDSTGQKVERCDCEYAFPTSLVIPYDTEWSFDTHPMTVLRQHRGLRLMGRFTGRNPEQLAELSHVGYLYLSRYPRFTFDWLANFEALESLELDLVGIESLAGIEHVTGLLSLSLTECRKLCDLSALAVAPRLRVLRVAICGKLMEFKPVSSQLDLIAFTLEGKNVQSLEFLRPLSKLRRLGLNAKVVSEGLQPLYRSNVEHMVLAAGSLRKADIAAFQKERPSCQVRVV